MTPDQHRLIQQALANHRRPPRTHGARVHDALQHVRQSEAKPATLAEASGLLNNKMDTSNYGTNQTKGQR
jgi:hypothetical protein